MESKFNILFLSNMMVEKGVWVLLDACCLLKECNIEFECHFVGKWSDISEADFSRFVSENSLSDIVFAHGAKYGVEKQKYFDEANVFVFPTFYHNETFGLVLVEAMQNKLPCIATAEGGIPDIIDPTTGFIIDRKSPSQLASKIEILINDPQLGVEMGKEGYRKYKAKFTIEHFESRIKDILATCCNIE